MEEPLDEGGAGNPSSRELDVVAPGEEDVELGSTEFDQQAKFAASAQSTGVVREKWGNKQQFLMSCIASAVGLGNVWRFPAVCAKYGGASFFIPYMVVLFIIARPLFLLELSLGQFSSKGSVRCWDCSPIFTGVGIAGSISSILLSSFYIMLMAWALIYATLSLISMIGGDMIWGEHAGQFFGEEVLRAVDFNGVGNNEAISYAPICHLVLALLISWLIIWGTMVRGVQASGKVAYVTALAPYVVLITLVSIGVFLKGAGIGLKYFFFPDVKKLLDPRTWYEAVGQCFFSLGIGFGGLIMFSSFNEFHHEIVKDVVLISIVDFVTSILAGVSLMTILGFEASKTYITLDYDEMMHLMDSCFTASQHAEHQSQVFEVQNGIGGVFGRHHPKDPAPTLIAFMDQMKTCQLKKLVADGGAGIAFVQYPAAMFHINQEWGKHLGGFLSLIFFLMIILLAIGSANGFVGTTVTIISDRKPEWKRSNIVGGVCTLSFFIGLLYSNRFGGGWIDVVDTHGVTAVVYVLGFFEAVAVFYVYGLKNYCDDMEFMRNGKKVHWYFKICWMLLPVFMITVYIAWLIIPDDPPRPWTIAIKCVAWLITAFCILIIPGVAIFKFFQFKKNPWRKDIPMNFKSIFLAICNHSPRWGPKDPEIRSQWKRFKSERPSSYGLWRRLFKGGRVQGTYPAMSSPGFGGPDGEKQFSSEMEGNEGYDPLTGEPTPGESGSMGGSPSGPVFSTSGPVGSASGPVGAASGPVGAASGPVNARSGPVN